MSELIEQAMAFAIRAHESIDHRRKYSDEPYWTHPQAVAEIVSSVCDDSDVIAAAWLHDTVEDTPVTLEQIEAQFGARIAALVADLTDISCQSDGNRKMRKALDREHTANAHPDAKTVKLADLIHNTQSIVEHAPGFASVYLEEKRQLLEVLKEGDQRLYKRAQVQLRAASEKLAGRG